MHITGGIGKLACVVDWNASGDFIFSIHTNNATPINQYPSNHITGVSKPHSSELNSTPSENFSSCAVVISSNLASVQLLMCGAFNCCCHWQFHVSWNMVSADSRFIYCTWIECTANFITSSTNGSWFKTKASALSRLLKLAVSWYHSLTTFPTKYAHGYKLKYLTVHYPIYKVECDIFS